MSLTILEKREQHMAEYKILKTEGRAKRAEFKTVHGTIQTPVFMNVGTARGNQRGGIDRWTSGRDQAPRWSCPNTYHLHVRPGDEAGERIWRPSQVYGLGSGRS